jgi:hypothetical protein
MAWDDGLILHFQTWLARRQVLYFYHANASGWWPVVLHIVVGLSYPQTSKADKSMDAAAMEYGKQLDHCCGILISDS